MKDIGFRTFLKEAAKWVLKWRHPFWWLPDVPTEQDESFRKIWASLRQVEYVTDGRHDTDNFLSRKGDLVLVCARIPEDAVNPEIHELQSVIARQEYARLVPPNPWQITIQELGFLSNRPNGRDEITEDWLEEFLEQCQLSLKDFRPFDVRIGGANSFTDAAILDIHDNGWFSRIHDVLVDFVSQPPRMRYPYLPEFVIAQYTHDAPIGTLVHDLTPYRDREFGNFRVENIDVIRIPTSGSFDGYSIVRSYPLGQLTGFMDRVTSAEAGERQGHQSAPPRSTSRDS